MYNPKKVIILIDEYDVPLDKAFRYGYYDEMVMLIPGAVRKCIKDEFEFVFCGADRLSSCLERKHFYRT